MTAEGIDITKKLEESRHCSTLRLTGVDWRWQIQIATSLSPFKAWFRNLFICLLRWCTEPKWLPKFVVFLIYSNGTMHFYTFNGLNIPNCFEYLHSNCPNKCASQLKLFNWKSHNFVFFHIFDMFIQFYFVFWLIQSRFDIYAIWSRWLCNAISLLYPMCGGVEWPIFQQKNVNWVKITKSEHSAERQSCRWFADILQYYTMDVVIRKTTWKYFIQIFEQH